MLTKILSAPFKLLAPIKRYGYRIYFASGAAIAIFFIVWSLLLDKQAIAVILAAIGAGLGVLIMSLSLPKLLLAADGARQKQLELEMQQALKQQTKLSAELERIKSQQLQLQQIQSVLKLTLLEVEVSLTDFKQSDLGEREKTLGGKTSTQYVGVLRKKMKAMLGLDIGHIRVKQLNNELHVNYLRTSYQGASADSDEWLFRQLQIHEDNLLFPNRININVDSQMLMEAADLHREDLSERIKNGIELKAFDQAIERMGEQWLKLMFLPMGLTVVITDVNDGIPLLDFLKQRDLNLTHAEQLLLSNGVQ